MNRIPDVELVLRDYFADDGLTAPNHLLDVVEGRISRQPQRHTWRVAWRNPMSTPLKLAAGLTAVVLIALVGWQLLPGQKGGVGGQGSPTPIAQPSATPVASLASTAPSPGAVLPPWYTTTDTPSGRGILPAGSHTTRAFRPGFTFSVPNGWVNDTDEASYFFLFPDTPANQAEFARSESLAQVILMGVHPTPWFTCESLENNRGATAAERVAAASANEVLAVSDQVEVAIGGLTGLRFDVRRNPNWTGTCPADAELPAGVNPEDERSRVIFLDVPGGGVLGMILYSKSSAEFDAFLAEAMTIVESFEFDLAQ